MIIKGQNVKIGKSNVRLGENIVIGDNSVIEDRVSIGGRVKIGRNVIIKSGTYIGDGAIIEDNTILGYRHITKYIKRNFRKDIHIGKKVLIRNNCVLYIGVSIGERTKINHNVVIREGTSVGKDSSIGNFTVLEGHLEIGDCTSIFSNVHISPFSKIGNFVFVGPGVVTTNDYHLTYARKKLERKTKFQGPLIEDGARIGGGVVLMPKVKIGKEAVIGAGSFVSEEIPAFKVAMGWPARIIKDVVPDEYITKKWKR